ncbi:MAG: serine hydrolase [Acidobacteriota bacterium]|nr:serine hydrolase [Acidobacteriota bacterium]
MRINFIRINLFVTLAALCLFSVQLALAQNPTASSAQQIAAEVDEYLNAAVKYNHFSGSVLMARDGQPVISKGYGMANYELNVPNTPQTVFRIGSITKQFTAVAIMILQERSKLNVNDPICKHLENCPAAWRPVTIRHLLTNTSGIPSYTDLPGFNKMSVQPVNRAELVDLFRDKPLEFTPGEKFAYSNSGYYLLGLIIEKASGKPYAEFLRDNIFVPLGMKNSGYDDSHTLLPNRANGYKWEGKSFVNAPYIDMATPYSAGALYSTTEDLLLWDKALYTEKLVSRKSLDEMFAPFREVVRDGWGGYAYAYGWIIGKQSGRQVSRHDGGIKGFSTDIIRFPSERVTVIVLSNNQTVIPYKLANDLSAIAFGAPYKLPTLPVSEVLAATIAQKGIAPALQQYRELKRARPDNYDFSEPVLDRLGYDLLRSQKVKEAIEIFKLNVEMFPQAFNVYDSLGEAYMVNGDKELAIKNYEKALELNPQNTNSVNMLKKLRGNK